MALVVIALVLILAASVAIKEKDFGFFWGVSAVGLFIGFLACVLVSVFFGGRWYVEHPLVTMQDGQTVHGSFFLGSGNIDGVSSFSWYEKSGDSYYLQNIPAWKGEVRYTTGQPHVVWDCRNENASFVTWPLHLDPSPNCDSRSTYVTFYVPEGSVKNEYTLDAKE